MIFFKKESIINLLILFSSCIFSLLIINFFWIFYISNYDQKNGFPRKFLKYVPRPTSSWNYPDLNNNNDNQLDQFLIIGDSYAEGMGDAFLNNQYNYSTSHFLKKGSKYSILLAANSGSNIPYQLERIERSFQNIYLPNKVNKYLNKDNINLIAFFYEGNDLENLIILEKYKTLRPGKNNKVKRYFNKNFPLIVLIKRSIVDIKKGITNRAGKQFKVNSGNEVKKTVKICRNNKCRIFDPIQSAAPELTLNQIDHTISETIDSLVNFKNKYNSNVCLVYIPSIATLYSPDEIHYQEYLKNGNGLITSKENLEKSKYIRNKFSSVLNNEKIDFYDSTKFMKRFADKEFIHGIRDKKHFNRKGYKLLADFLLPKMSNCLKK